MRSDDAARQRLREPADAADTSPRSAPDPQALDPEDVRRCRELLEAIVADRGLLAAVPLEERRALLVAAGRVSRPETHQERRLVRTLRRRRRADDEAADRLARNATGIRAARQAPVFHAPQRLLEAAARAQAPGPELRRPKACYVCKSEYRRLHFFYDALCPECAALNYAKRHQHVDLSGRVALVTGARVKIGFHTALKLLRAGATVIASTRFPHDAARRYAGEADFSEWADRLHVHGLDLRHAPSVELFCRFVAGEHERLDLLINNACQTVRRPAGFYTPLLDFEQRAPQTLPADLQGLLRSHRRCLATVQEADGRNLPGGSERALAPWQPGFVGLGLHASARLSQIDARVEDLGAEVFPAGLADADLQQVDLRTHNSWRLTLAEVPTTEMIEVQLVNAVAPFILCSRLKPLMLRTPGRDKHVVNVSAMEGVFSRGTKTDRHPHTNMAKAALNMLTLTSARDYVKDGIHMNAVDTGWITDEDPFQHAQRKREELDFQPPLDVVDGAARLCDPFFSGLATGSHVWGKFLKDYRPAPW